MERKEKLRKLNAFRRRLPHVTASALAAILAAVYMGDVPELYDRSSIRESRDLQAEQATPFGPIIQTVEVLGKDDLPKHMHIAHPLAMLWVAATECQPFMAFFKAKLLEKLPTFENPWNIILYTDEVTPGNPLATNNKRKFHAAYWSFLEFGANALSREEAWFVAITEYSTWINDIHAGLSQAVGAILKTLFDSKGFDMQVGGINIPFATGDVRLWARLGVMIQDGGAHKTVWSSRGDAASKYCLLCKNLFTSTSRICDQDGASMLICTATNLADLQPSTDAELRTNARFLEGKASVLRNDDFLLLQQSMGMTHHKKALLLDRSLDAYLSPTKVYMHDWMHALFVDGVVNSCIYLLFEAFITIGFKKVYTTFSDYSSNWKFPKRLHAAHLSEIFSASRKDKHRDAKHIKCQASDLLTLTPVLALFTRKVLLSFGVCREECIAFLALADVVELILSTSRNKVTAPQLLGRVHRFLDTFVHAFGEDYMTPKYHWLLHLPECLLKFGLLLNCFVLERKHRCGKRYATDLANTSRNPSKSLLSEVLSHQLGLLQQPAAFDFEIGLVGGRAATPKARRLILQALGQEDDDDDLIISVADESRFNQFGSCHRNDVVLVREGNSFRAGRVELHCSIEGEALSFINIWSLVSHEPAQGYAVWKQSDSAEVCFTSDIIDTISSVSLPDGNVGTLLPVDYR
jgi:hypothetical protein